jgi:hypothetical protein
MKGRRRMWVREGGGCGYEGEKEVDKRGCGELEEEGRMGGRRRGRWGGGRGLEGEEEIDGRKRRMSGEEEVEEKRRGKGGG